MIFWTIGVCCAALCHLGEKDCGCGCAGDCAGSNTRTKPGPGRYSPAALEKMRQLEAVARRMRANGSSIDEIVKIVGPQMPPPSADDPCPPPGPCCLVCRSTGTG